MKSAILFSLAATGAMALSCYGVDIVNDTWLDGERLSPASPVYSENGVDADADGNIESAWFRSGTGVTLTAVPGGPMTAAGISSSAFLYTYFTQPSSQVTLANAGDELKVTLVFTPTGLNTGNTSQGLPVALANAPTRQTADGSAPPSALYSGYALFMNMSPTFANGNPFQLREWTATSAGSLLGTAGNWGALINDGTSGNHGWDNGTQYTLVFDLVRTASSGLDVTATLTGGTLNGDGSLSVNYVDSTPNTFTYDTFALRPSQSSQASTGIVFSSFRVQFIPEPSTLALLGLGLAGFACAYRRARR